MHDGRFETLEEVVEHYTQEVQDHPALSFTMQLNTSGGWGGYHSFASSELLAEGLQPGDPLKFNLTESDKQALIAFLHTLTDEELVRDVRFSDPFVRVD